MSRRFSAGWLAGAIVIVMGFGIAGSTIPLRPCRSCDGLVTELISRTSPALPSTSSLRLNCPDCSDRGKETLFRSWMRPRVSEPVANVVRGLKDATGSQTLNAMVPLLHADGFPFCTFLGNAGLAETLSMKARYLEVAGKDYLLLLVNYPAMHMPGTSGASILLISPEGHALDYLHLTCNNRDANLYGDFLDPLSPDGAQLMIQPTLGAFLNIMPDQFRYELCRFELKPREGVFEVPANYAFEGICRLRIRGKRLDVLTPK